MYELKRSKEDNVQLKLNDEVLTIHLFGLKQYQQFRQASERLNEIQERLSKMTDDVSTETVQFLQDSVSYLMEVVLGKDNSEKIEQFFEGNFDEMIKALMPFIEQIFIPALDKQIKVQSKERAEQYVSELSEDSKG